MPDQSEVEVLELQIKVHSNYADYWSAVFNSDIIKDMTFAFSRPDDRVRFIEFIGVQHQPVALLIISHFAQQMCEYHRSIVEGLREKLEQCKAAIGEVRST